MGDREGDDDGSRRRLGEYTEGVWEEIKSEEVVGRLTS